MEKSKISINVEGGFLFCGGWNFFKSVSVGSTFIREMRVWQLGGFSSAAPTAPKSSKLHFRFIDSFIQPSLVGSLFHE